MSEPSNETSATAASAHDCTIAPEDDRIVWIDCEMTGLEPERHVMVEIAALVTDANLNILGDGVDIVIHATETELAQMDDFVTNMHESNGLTDEIRASTTDITAAETAVLNYIKEWVPGARIAPLAGNSIASDRGFIHRYMPELDQFLHYRMIDVSSFKELARRWYPAAYSGQPQKGMSHRALADIKESIRELDFYRRAMLVEKQKDAADIESAAQAASDRFPI